jgi:hypothetical protein
VCLVECRWDRTNKLPKEKRYKWYVSAPTIKSQSGKYLAGDLEGRDPTVHLVDEKGADTRWAFEFVSTFHPQFSTEKGVQKEGSSGFAFRVKLAEGRFKN